MYLQPYTSASVVQPHLDFNIVYSYWVLTALLHYMSALVGLNNKNFRHWVSTVHLDSSWRPCV